MKLAGTYGLATSNAVDLRAEREPRWAATGPGNARNRERLAPGHRRVALRVRLGDARRLQAHSVAAVLTRRFAMSPELEAGRLRGRVGVRRQRAVPGRLRDDRDTELRPGD